MVTIEKMPVLFLFTIFGQKSYSYEVRCPKQSEWKYMAEAKCGNLLGYFCLKDKNINIYVEFCKQNPDIIRDITWKAGHKSVVRGNLDGEVCAIERYQPFKFKTNGNSDCVYTKSLCKDEGQIIYKNGSTTVDTHCRCDHTKGFALLSKTKQTCFCIPSTEDCSCYKKECKMNYKLSPDYTCTPIGNQDDQVACNGHHKRALINVDSQMPKLKKTERTDFSPERTFYVKNGIDWYSLKLVGMLMVAIGCIIFLLIYGFVLATKVEVQTLKEMTRQMIDEFLETELRVVVIGKVGVGKSAICNMIIEENVFESRNGMAAVTTETQYKQFNIHGQNILLIDTPGVFGNISKEEKVKGEIKRCIKIGSPGLHAILFVMKLGRMTEEDNNTIKTFLKYFGKSDLEERVILVFTHDNSTDPANYNLHDPQSKTPEELKKLMDRSHDRVVNFNIELDKDKGYTQVNDLLNQIKKLRVEKAMKYYSDSYFCEAETEKRSREDEILKEPDEQIFKKSYESFKYIRSKATEDILNG